MKRALQKAESARWDREVREHGGEEPYEATKKEQERAGKGSIGKAVEVEGSPWAPDLTTRQGQRQESYWEESE
jgi:hypothetical protein